MSGIVLFVHGTGARDVSDAISDVREGVRKHLGWSADSVVAVEWGRAVGPQDLDVRPALPPEDATRGAGGEDVTADDEAAALWDVLAADPLAELRLVAELPAATGAAMIAGSDPAGVVLGSRVAALAPPASLAAAELTDADLAAAKKAVTSDPVLSRAATAAGDADDVDLVAVTARAVVARMLREHGYVAGPPRAAYDAAARDALVAEVATGLAPAGTRGIGGRIGKLLLPLATRVAVAKRADFMGPLSDFIRDVAFYVQHGERVRDYIAGAIRARKGQGPVVVLAHSLGGIACVDLLSDPAPKEPLEVDLLVTCGSQAPLLYLMDALAYLSPRNGDMKPYTPWVNIYNRQDLLSFCATRVFVNAPAIEDVAVAAGVPFPMSHSAYWTQDAVYEAIRAKVLP